MLRLAFSRKLCPGNLAAVSGSSATVFSAPQFPFRKASFSSSFSTFSSVPPQNGPQYAQLFPPITWKIGQRVPVITSIDDDNDDDTTSPLVVDDISKVYARRRLGKFAYPNVLK